MPFVSRLTYKIIVHQKRAYNIEASAFLSVALLFSLPFSFKEGVEVLPIPFIAFDHMQVGLYFFPFVREVPVGLDERRGRKIGPQGTEIFFLLGEIVGEIVDVLVFHSLVDDRLFSGEEIAERKVGFLSVLVCLSLDFDDGLEEMPVVQIELGAVHVLGDELVTDDLKKDVVDVRGIAEHLFSDFLICLEKIASDSEGHMGIQDKGGEKDEDVIRIGEGREPLYLVCLPGILFLDEGKECLLSQLAGEELPVAIHHLGEVEKGVVLFSVVEIGHIATSKSDPRR